MTYPVVVYGVPYIPPPPPVKPFRRGTNKWHGWDGSVWDLGDFAGGVVFADGGASGFHMPPFERQTSISPAIAGSRYKGTRTAERPVDWNVLVWSDANSQEWLERDAGFAKTLWPDKTGVWEHTDPEGRSRFLRLRCDGGDLTSIERGDPHLQGWSLYQLQFVAEEPHWYGEEIVRSWSSPAPVDFFGTTGGPPFNISASSTIATATIDNPGDVAAWPTWTLKGPLTSISIEVNGGGLGLPNLAAGQTLVINTDPRVATAELDGVDVAGLVDPWDPREVPPGEAVPAAISVTGSGEVHLSLTPRYYRAW